MNFTADVVQTQTLQLMDLGFYTINTLDERSRLSTPATYIKITTDGSNWSAPNHVFGEAIEVGTSEENSYHYYKYKTEFQIWK